MVRPLIIVPFHANALSPLAATFDMIHFRNGSKSILAAAQDQTDALPQLPLSCSAPPAARHRRLREVMGIGQ